MHPEAIANDSDALLWNPPGIGVTASITRSVLSGIREALLRSASPSPQEFGGILLGSFESEDGETYHTRIDGFESFQVEHRYGSGFSLSLRDQRRLRQRLERLERGRSHPVGFFRTHLRRGLYLDQRDFELFQSEFRHPSSVFLLVRSEEDGHATGALFIWEGDDMRRHASHKEFAIEGDVPVPALRLSAPPAPASIDAPRPHVNEFPGLNWKLPHVDLSLPRLSWKVPVWHPDLSKLRPALLLLAAVGLPLGAFYLGRDVGLHEHHGSELTRSRQPAHAARRSAPPVETAKAIVPPASGPAVPFAAAVPAAPAYQPPANEAAIPAAVPDEGPDLGAPTKAPEPAKAASDNPRSFRERSADAASAKSRRRIWRGAPDSQMLAAPALPDPPDVTAAASVPHVSEVPAALLRSSGGSAKVVAYIKPAKSGVRHALRKFFGGGSGNSENFVPASPVEHPLPTVRHPKTGEVEQAVELAAKVDRSGKVVNVKVVQGDRQLAGVSADVLQHWKFEPARQNGSPVESEMLVRFEFSNSSR